MLLAISDNVTTGCCDEDHSGVNFQHRRLRIDINDPGAQNGAIGYVYDKVGNRKQMSSTVPAIPPGMFYYDANDRLTTDAYDSNGNTTSSAGIQNEYDFENRLVRHGDVTIVYDGDGNRVAETVGGVTTNYLVDTQNPTGYAQVLEELQGGAVVRSYSWGHWLLAQKQLLNDAWTTSFYGYDGHGSVRYLTDSTGAVTDTYDYDAFGNLISSTGTTPNNYLFAGEQYDPTLGLYYNRARYYDERIGRFSTQDTDEGILRDPLTLHLYLYVNADPTNFTDHTGQFLDTIELVTSSLADLVNRGAAAGRLLILGARALALARQAAAVVTASALIASSIASSIGSGGGGIDALNGQEGEGREVEQPIYRDADGTNPGAFSFTAPTYPDIDKREISLLETPKRDRKYVVPFRVRYTHPKMPKFTVGGIVNFPLAQLVLQARYSPLVTPGHWSLLGNLYDTDAEQQAIKQALASYAKQNAERTGN